MRKSTRCKLPTSCRISYRTYDLSWWPVNEARSANARGVHEDHTSAIRIAEDLTPADAAETLIHEILHACWRNVSLSGDVEENAVSVLADNLAQVWRDNPAVIKWVSAQLGST